MRAGDRENVHRPGRHEPFTDFRCKKPLFTDGQTEKQAPTGLGKRLGGGSDPAAPFFDEGGEQVKRRLPVWIKHLDDAGS